MSKFCKKSKFFVRLLPTEDADWENIKIESNEEVIHVRCIQDFNRIPSICIFKSQDTRPRFWTFQTDGVFYRSCQNTIYDTVMEGVITSIYEGVNTVIMALGQTCSGKSFTMSALRSVYEYRGIIPRFISAVFSDIGSKTKEWKVTVGVTFIEVLGNTIHDLLSDTPSATCKVKKVHVINVKNEEDALLLLFKGEGRRKTTDQASYLGANCASGIFTLKFECLSLIRSHAFLNRSEVHFIDLAGVETVGKRELTSFKSARYQGAANQTKYDLEQVLVHMGKDYDSDKQIKKTCKLVEYLHSSMLRGCILRVIGHIRPTFADLEVTLSTLKFGHKVKHVPTVPVTRYTEPNIELMFQNIKDELNQLREQMIVEKLLSGSHEVESGNFSQSRLKHLERLANAYLQGWSSEVNVLGNTEHIVILQTFKRLFEKKEIENTLKESSTRHFSYLDIEQRNSKTTKISRKSKEELEQIPQNTKKKSLREMKKIGSKSGGVLYGKGFPVPSTSSYNELEKDVIPEISMETKHENLINSVHELIAPDTYDKKIWEDFLIEQHIDPRYLEDLAELIKKKKVAYEQVFTEYDGTRLNLERNRLALKEIAWKRHVGQNEMYDKFGQVVITQEEKSTAKLVANLEFIERSTKKLLDEKYLEWKEASKDFLKEKSIIEEKFKEFCSSKINMQIHTPAESKYEVSLHYSADGEQIELLKKDHVSKYYSVLQKKLREKDMKIHKQPMWRKSI